MFSKSKDLKNSRQDFSNYVDGYDIYNSRIFDLLKEHDGERILYEIHVNEFRPDLIAKDLYGSSVYLGFLYISAGLGLENYKKGAIISVYPKYVIEEVINSLK